MLAGDQMMGGGERAGRGVVAVTDGPAVDLDVDAVGVDAGEGVVSAGDSPWTVIPVAVCALALIPTRADPRTRTAPATWAGMRIVDQPRRSEGDSFG